MKARSMLVGITAGLLTLGLTVPASAATSGASTATLTVDAGFLAITVPASATLGARTNTVDGGTISGSLGEVFVEDARSAAEGAGWVTSVISTSFTVVGGTAIAASAVSYSAGTIAKFGTATYAANDPGNLTGVTPAVTATGITGDNSATWTPQISVAVPGGAMAGLYTATVTHSLV